MSFSAGTSPLKSHIDFLLFSSVRHGIENLNSIIWCESSVIPLKGLPYSNSGLAVI